jgi:F-type H+-transporting ATPase subunit alpha
LKLDQAQYRELEAFAKFGSDLDAATKAVLEKGKRNVEILKQGLHQPFKVEQQIAIIYCGTQGLLKDVPVERVKEFEAQLIEHLELKYKDTMATLASGKLTDEVTETLRKVAAELSESFKE